MGRIETSFKFGMFGFFFWLTFWIVMIFGVWAVGSNAHDFYCTFDSWYGSIDAMCPQAF